MDFTFFSAFRLQMLGYKPCAFHSSLVNDATRPCCSEAFKNWWGSFPPALKLLRLPSL